MHGSRVCFPLLYSAVHSLPLLFELAYVGFQTYGGTQRGAVQLAAGCGREVVPPGYLEQYCTYEAGTGFIRKVRRNSTCVNFQIWHSSNFSPWKSGKTCFSPKYLYKIKKNAKRYTFVPTSNKKVQLKKNSRNTLEQACKTPACILEPYPQAGGHKHNNKILAHFACSTCVPLIAIFTTVYQTTILLLYN